MIFRQAKSGFVAGALLAALLVSFASPAADKAYRRIVSVGGPITEIIYALGEQSRIVAIDTSSIFPAETDSLHKVGYQRALSAEGVISQRPDLLIATDAAGPQNVLKQIAGTGVDMHIIQAENSYQGLLEKISSVSKVMGVPEKGEKLIASITNKMEPVLQAVKKKKKSRARIVFLLNVGQGPLMVAGHSTAADSIIGLAGGENPMAHFEGYKPVNAESLVAVNPDIILLTNRTLDAMGMEGVLDVPGVRLTAAARNNRIVAMDGLLLLGFTPRLPEAIRELNDYINS